MALMYRVEKEIEIAGAHTLCLDYESKCNNLHGHNWIIKVTCEAKELNKNGMVVDFTAISNIVKSLDHKDLNSVIPNPTAENIAKYLCDLIPNCVRVEINESRGNKAIYEA